MQRWSVLLQKVATRFPEWSRNSQFIYFFRTTDDRGVFRIRVSGGEAERIVDLKNWHLTGQYRLWMGLDPTDAPLLLRDEGRDDIYPLTLDQK